MMMRCGWLVLVAMMWLGQASASNCDGRVLADCVGLPPAGVDFLDIDPMGVPISLYYDRQRRAALERQLKATLRDDPDDANAAMDLGILAAQAGRKPERQFQRAATLAGDDALRLRRLAWARGHACMALGDADCALRHWHEAAGSTAVRPGWLPSAYAYALWAVDRPEQAVAWYSAAVRADVRLGRGHHAATVGVGTALNPVSRELFSAWAERHAVRRTMITAEVEIDTEGRVARLLVPDGQLDERLLRQVRIAVPRWRFDPATDAGGRIVTLATHLHIELRMGAEDGEGTDVEIQYAGMGPVVEARDLQYPLLALRQNQQGTVLLNVAVGTDGRADAVEVLASSGHQLLDNGAREGVKMWTFKPDRLDGQPVAANLTLPIVYQINDGPDWVAGHPPSPTRQHTHLRSY